jgi:hypothetical protein
VIFRLSLPSVEKNTRQRSFCLCSDRQSNWKQCYNCPKMVHVGLHSVWTYHKKFGGQNKKNKNVLCRVSKDDTRQRHSLPSAIYLALGKESALPSAGFRPSAKADGLLTAVSCRRPLTALCRAPSLSSVCRSTKQYLSSASLCRVSRTQ